MHLDPNFTSAANYVQLCCLFEFSALSSGIAPRVLSPAAINDAFITQLIGTWSCGCSIYKKSKSKREGNRAIEYKHSKHVTYSCCMRASPESVHSEHSELVPNQMAISRDHA